MNLIDLSVYEYVKKAEDKTSVPGGGSISALCGALAASLAVMVLKLSEAEADNLIPYREPSEKLIENIDEDSRSFDDVLKAFRMPKNTEEEIERRKEEIQKGYIRAIEVPLETMRQSEKILSLLKSHLSSMTQEAISDVFISADLAKTAFQGAKSTAFLNIGALKDETLRREYVEAIEKLEKSVEENHRIIRENEK